MKHSLFIICALWMGFSSSVWAAPAASKPFVVVIDAGHGGQDPGAIGQRSQEKDLNLKVALLAGQLIKENHPEVKVFYTRETDFFIPLQKRADFVNKNDANLFICIHTNASPNASAQGMETFVLGTDKMESNLDVAMRENAVIKLETDYQTTYQGFDPNSVDSYIMFELMQNQYMDQSLTFASLLQQQFANTLKRGDRGVRQAAFWVLLKSACPSVLVEMGFISNASDEQYLVSSKGQNEIAQAIENSFATFYKQIRKEKVVATPEPQTKPQTKPQTTSSAKPQQQLPTPSTEVYAVQLFASHTILPDNDARFHGLQGCYYIQKGEWYKYYYGREATREAAAALKEQVKNKFPDCFVIKLQ
ncbi:MAG: N-acetylmuramoyl-L-alanine amidase [Paludibacteraceae bacterium]|nr:N-acetylmuramoyl-L-alanine amidase [Paludibacteraceae bacterium]